MWGVPGRGKEGTIVLCGLCAVDLLLSPKFSLASGHNYGRCKNFPRLSGTNLSVCLPQQNYSTDIVIKENHATGHSICFPSSGPTEAAKVLPCIDDTQIPLLTFLGPHDKWTTETCRGSFTKFYEVDPNKLVYEHCTFG
jgi:hypothetical protein